MRRIKSIQTKIGAALIAIITAILGAFGGYQYFTTQTELTTELQELSTISASRLAEQLTEPLWNYDPIQAEKILRSYMIDKRCYALIIVDPKENIFKGVQRDADWQVMLTREAVTGKFVTASQEIGRDNKQLGRVEVYITPQFMRERLTSELIKIGVTIIMLDLALLAGLILVLRRLVIHPLNHLLANTTVIAQGDFRQQIRIQQEDEIGKLAAEFRTMIAYMQAMATAATRIADGDLRQDITPRSDHDVLGTAFQRMSGYLKQIAMAAENLSKGDLSQEVQLRTSYDLLGKTFRNMNARLNDIVLDVKAAAACVTTGSQDLNRTAEQMSQGTSQQAAAAEEVSSSMEEMVANIRQNMENARITEKIALESSADAQKGGVAMLQTIEAMKAIAERISVIQQIANQTNILSLNATIEASKAQDFGKGFAVVASEVRELARHTHEAAKEIETLVRSCEVITEEAGAILRRLVPNSQRTADLIQEISAASTEQYTGAEQVNKAVQQLDAVIQENAAMTEEMASASEELASQAEHLQTEMAFFTVQEKRVTSQDQDTALTQSLHDLLTILALDDQQSTQLINTIIALKRDQKTPGPVSKEDAITLPPEEKIPAPQADEPMLPRNFQDEVDAEFERF